MLLVMALFVAALIFREANLLLLAMPFLTYTMMGILRSPGEVKLRAWRSHNKSTGATLEPIEMSVRVENIGHSQVYLCLQDSPLPSMQIVDGQLSRHIYLASGEQAAMKYTFQVGRGIYAWKAIRVVATDPFSLFEQNLDWPAPAEIMVRPRSIRLRNLPLKPQMTRHILGSMPARLAGSGTSFFGIREYQAGDPLRRINWRMTARYPRKLFTKEFEQDEIVDIGLILDSRKLEGDDAGEDSIFEHAVCATTSLAEFFLREGNRVGLLIFGEKMTAVFPSSGKKHLFQIYRYLAQASAKKSIPLEYLNYFSYRLFPRGSIIFMISPFGYRDLPTYSRLAAEGHQVILISPNPIDYAAQKMPVNQINSLAYRASRLERYVQLSQLLSMGIRVVDWPIDRALNDVIREILAPLHIGDQRRVQR